MKMNKKEFYTKEKDCVMDATLLYYDTYKTQLIFKKKRKYIIIQGDLLSKTEIGPSTIRQQYENDGWELRGWVSDMGCCKNN